MRGRPVLALAVAGSIVAISTAAILIRYVDEDVAPIAIGFYRLLYATLLLLPFAFWRARDELRQLSRSDVVGLILVGAVLAVHFAAWITSLDLTSVAASVVLVTLHPVFVALVSQRVFGEGVGARGYVGIGLALVGGVVITWGDARSGPEPLVGDTLALLGALAAAIYFLAGRGYRKRLSLLAYVTPVYASCAFFLGLLLLLPSPYGGSPFGIAPRDHILFLAMAVVPMILGHTVLNWALKYVTAPAIATTILGEPLGSTVLAVVLLDEVPGALTIGGGALVLVGIAMVAFVEGRRA